MLLQPKQEQVRAPLIWLCKSCVFVLLYCFAPCPPPVSVPVADFSVHDKICTSFVNAWFGLLRAMIVAYPSSHTPLVASSVTALFVSLLRSVTRADAFPLGVFFASVMAACWITDPCSMSNADSSALSSSTVGVSSCLLSSYRDLLQTFEQSCDLMPPLVPLR